MDHRVDSYRQGRPEGVHAEPTKHSAYYPNSYEPLSHHNARQVPFEVAKTWDGRTGGGRAGLRHSHEAGPSAGLLSALESSEVQQQQQYLQQKGHSNAYYPKAGQEYALQRREPSNARGDRSHQQAQWQQQQIKAGRIGIFGNYLASRISSTQQQKFLLASATEDAKAQAIMDKYMAPGQPQNNTQRVRPPQQEYTGDSIDAYDRPRGSRNVAPSGLQTADQVFGTFEQTKPIILSRLQNHFSVQDNKVMHAICKRDSVLSTRRKGGPGSLEPSIDVDKLPPVLQDMKFVKKHIQNARVMLSPMRQSYDPAQGAAAHSHLVSSAQMVEAELRALEQHHPGNAGAMADDQPGHHAPGQAVSPGAGMARREGAEDRQLQNLLDAEHTYSAGPGEQRAHGGRVVPKISVKATANGQLHQSADQFAPGTSSSSCLPAQAPWQSGPDTNEAPSASARRPGPGQPGFRLNPYLVEKMAKQIRALSQTPHHADHYTGDQHIPKGESNANLRRSYDQALPAQVPVGPIQRALLDSLKPRNYSKRGEDAYPRPGPRETVSKADPLRSSGKTKAQHAFDDKQRSLIERIWGKQYSLEAKELPQKGVSPRVSANINSMAGNQPHQALAQPSPIGAAAASDTPGFMSTGSVEGHAGQQRVLAPQINLSLSCGQALSPSPGHGQAQSAYSSAGPNSNRPLNPRIGPKPAHSASNYSAYDKTPVWLSKHGDDLSLSQQRAADDLLIREVMQQQNLQKRHSQSPMGARDSPQKNVRLKQQPEPLRASNGPTPSSLRPVQAIDSLAMLDYKDYNFIVGKKGQQALAKGQRYASQQPAGQDGNQYSEVQQTETGEDLRRSRAGGRSSAIMLRVEGGLNHDVSLGRGLGPAANASEEQEHWSLAMVKDRSQPHANNSAQRQAARPAMDGGSSLTTKGSHLSLSSKQPLKPLQRQGSRPGPPGPGQGDDPGPHFRVTIKIQEERESRLTTPLAPRAPAAHSPTTSTLSHTQAPVASNAQSLNAHRPPQMDLAAGPKYAAWDALTASPRDVVAGEVPSPGSPHRQYLRQLQESNPRKRYAFSPGPKLIELPEEQRVREAPGYFPTIPAKQAKKPQPQPDGGQGSRAAEESGGESASSGQDADGCEGMEGPRSPTSPRSPPAGRETPKSPFRTVLKPADGLAGQGPPPGHQAKLEEKREEQREQNRMYTVQGKCPYAKSRDPQKRAYIRFSKGLGTDVADGEDSEKERAARRAEEARQKEEQQKELMRKFLSKFPPRRIPNCHEILEEERRRFQQARKDANRKYTEISANSNKPGKFKHLQFVIFEGNNSQLIRRVMGPRLAGSQQQQAQQQSQLERSGSEVNTSLSAKPGGDIHAQAQQAQNYFTWEETTATHLFNFKWKPVSHGIVYDRLSKYGYKQLVNHIEGHAALTTKDQLFFNIRAHCERIKINVYDIIPLTFAVDFQEESSVQRYDQIMQVLHLFEKNLQLSHTELNVKLQALQVQHDKVIRTQYSVGPYEHQHKNLWLLKPAGLNRGIGIHVFNSCEDLQNILWTHYRIDAYEKKQPALLGDRSSAHIPHDLPARSRDPQHLSDRHDTIEEPDAKETDDGRKIKEIKNSSFIIQKYIEAPLLFKNRKFDIRIWALISHDARFYLFKEAYVRTSSAEYDLSDQKLDQVYVHLTNNAVQQYSKNYGQHEEGNIVSMNALVEELSKDEYNNGQSADQIKTDLYRQMSGQIIHSYNAVLPKLKFSKHTFELVGYDFMVIPSDEQNFETRLIEANTNPCLEESNALLKAYLPRMADDMLKIVLDPLFGTQVGPATQGSEGTAGGEVQATYPVEGYSDEESMFQLLTP